MKNLLQIDKNEELPRTLCNNCYDLLSKFSEFKRTCIKSQKILLTFRSVKKEIVNKVEVTDPQEILESNDEIDDWPFDNESLKLNFTTDNVCSKDIVMKHKELVVNSKNGNLNYVEYLTLYLHIIIGQSYILITRTCILSKN